MSAVVAELNRRKIPRTLGTYAVAAFIGLQLLDATGEALLLSQWVKTLVALLVILGFPIVFLLAWVFQVSGTGIKRQTGGLLSPRQTAGLFTAMLILTGALGAGLFQYYGDLLSGGQLAPGNQLVAGGVSTAPENSIAVLPFDDLSPGGDQAHFSDGIAEEILNILAQVDGLRVAARTSSFALRDKKLNIKEIGRLLNVSKILEGSLRTSGNQIRLTAQLINVTDGYHIWSKTYDRELNDIFAIQDEIAKAISESLVESFDGISELRSPFASTDVLASQQAYNTARLHWWRRGPEELQLAIAKFGEAIKADPDFAPAYSGLADSWLLLSSYGNISPDEAITKAQPLISHALELNPQSAEAFASLGLARWQIGQHDAAESSLRRAIELNDSYVPAKLWLAGVIADQGRLPENRLILEEALEQDPLNELLNINLGSLYFQFGEYDLGMERLQEIHAIKPNSAMILRNMANWASNYGRMADAWTWSQQSVELSPNDPLALTAAAQAWMDLGDFGQAQKVLDQALEVAAENLGVEQTYYFFLMAQGRVDEMRRLIGSGEQLDANSEAQTTQIITDRFNRGMLAMIENKSELAEAYLSQARDAIPNLLPDSLAMNLLTLLAYVQIENGKVAAAQASLDQVDRLLVQVSNSGMKMPDLYYVRAGIWAMRGDQEKALEALEAAYELGFRHSWLIAVDFRLNSMRDLPRFQAVLENIEKDVAAAREQLELPVVAVL